MSAQDDTSSSIKQRRSRKTNITSQQNGKQTSALQHPANDDKEAWKVYWKAQGQDWRTEPEIDIVRQKYLSERRAMTPNIEKGFYPFKDIKLNRADVEWLLATHEDGRGPVIWSDESQRERVGLDLRGANLRDSDLGELPLAFMQGGLVWSSDQTEEQRISAAILLQNANLLKANLQKSTLRGANFQEANLRETNLQGANLGWANFQEANLGWANLQEANLYKSDFQKANLYEADLQMASLRWAKLHKADLRRAKLEKSSLTKISLSTKQGIGPLLADVYWDGINLAVIEWSQMRILGDEYEAKQKQNRDGKVKEKPDRLADFEAAVRANRQIAVALQNQGLNEDAARFAYRAQTLQRVVLRLQRKFGQYLFSGFLDLLAGYGRKPIRSVIWYLVIILGFAMAYLIFGHLPFFPDSLVFSLTSFHGRGFFPGLGNETSLHNPLVVMAALEAVIGLLIEISFIATFTQRFFGK